MVLLTVRMAHIRGRSDRAVSGRRHSRRHRRSHGRARRCICRPKVQGVGLQRWKCVYVDVYVYIYARIRDCWMRGLVA